MDEDPTQHPDTQAVADARDDFIEAVRAQLAHDLFRIYAWVIDKLWRATKGLR